MPLKELALVAMLIYGQSVKAELLQVAILARHGNRAPNDDAPILCPNFLPTLKMFDVPYESLTGRGMEQLLELGNDMRDTYIKNLSFIPADLDMNTLYLRAGDSSRTLQVMVQSKYHDLPVFEVYD
jgi:hypothetical protein